MKRFLFCFVILLVMTLSFVLLSAGGMIATSSSPAEMNVTHFFTHALIANPKLAFSEKNSMKSAYDRDCITVSEFKEVLRQLHQNGYVLVDVNSLHNGKNKVNLKIPDGKKPLILSFDDINYYSKKMNRGMNDKIIVQNGRLATLLDGETHFDNEVVTVLENFISEHPDFSYRGARGVLCLTGFDGILGYRTQGDSPIKSEERAKVKPVIAELKKRNWRFACHSYGHYHMKSIDNAKFMKDVDKWKNEVEPLIGKTDIYVYPYGENDIMPSGNLTIKQNYLQKSGFNLFFGVGISPYFTNLQKSDSALFMDRIPLDGYTLRKNQAKLKKYFDAQTVLDGAVRPSRAVDYN